MAWPVPEAVAAALQVAVLPSVETDRTVVPAGKFAVVTFFPTSVVDGRHAVGQGALRAARVVRPDTDRRPRLALPGEAGHVAERSADEERPVLELDAPDERQRAREESCGVGARARAVEDGRVVDREEPALAVGGEGLRVGRCGVGGRVGVLDVADRAAAAAHAGGLLDGCLHGSCGESTGRREGHR
jgi:hypothetical protein